MKLTRTPPKAKLHMTPKMHAVLMDLVPALRIIFHFGFIPGEEMIRKLDTQTLKRLRASGRKVEGSLYTLEEGPFSAFSADHNFLDDEGIAKLKKGIQFFQQYALEHQLDMADQTAILEHAAKTLPDDLTEHSAFRQPALKVIEPGESTQSKRMDWMDFLEKYEGSEEVLTIQTLDHKGIQRMQSVSPAAEKKLEGRRLSHEEFKEYALSGLRNALDSNLYTF